MKPKKQNDMGADIIDFTEIKLHRFWELLIVNDRLEEADIMSRLIGGYLEGKYDCEWEHGDPCFSLNEGHPDWCSGMSPSELLRLEMISDEGAP